MNRIVISFLVVFHFAIQVSSYNILGLFPYPGRSHYIVFDALMVGLAERGHNVTVYNPFTKSFKLQNYREVDLKQCFTLPNVLSLEQMLALSSTRIPTSNLLSPFLPSENEILKCQPLIDLQTTVEPFDLLITETFHNDFFTLFGHVLKIPVITFHSAVLLPWMSNHAGVPENPSYIPHMYQRFSDKWSFWDRIDNLLLYVHSLGFYKLSSEYVFDRIALKFFGSELPTIGEMAKNVSMIFLNMHHSFNKARPLVPNAVEVGGINIKPAKLMPKDIEKFINESTHGVVYFCMGSLLRGETFPEEKRNAFLRAFARLPQRVLWKWEGDTLPGKPDNIMIAKWMPQRDILAHPNVKLFISHGGLLGTSEAVYEGVPILGIPIFGDQRTNLKSIESNGAGEILDYNEISEEVVYEKITRLLNNPQYKKDAVDLSIRYKDRPMSPLDTAVYWTEYVIRHKGAPHLKTAAVHMPWYEYLLLDVIAFLFVVLVTALIMIYYTLKFTLRFIYNMIFGGKNRQHESQKKIKRS